MANSRSNIYPVQLQGAELNLNKLDAEIKQYSGFNKNNAPFVGGCLSNIFTKDETIEGATSKNTYIAPNGDVYRVNTEGLWKNEEKLVAYPSNLYAFQSAFIEKAEIQDLSNYENVLDVFDENFFVYEKDSEYNDYYVKFFNRRENRFENIRFTNTISNVQFAKINIKRIFTTDYDYYVICFVYNGAVSLFVFIRGVENFDLSKSNILTIGSASLFPPICHIGKYGTNTKKIYIFSNNANGYIGSCTVDAVNGTISDIAEVTSSSFIVTGSNPLYSNNINNYYFTEDNIYFMGNQNYVSASNNFILLGQYVDNNNNNTPFRIYNKVNALSGAVFYPGSTLSETTNWFFKKVTKNGALCLCKYTYDNKLYFLCYSDRENKGGYSFDNDHTPCYNFGARLANCILLNNEEVTGISVSLSETNFDILVSPWNSIDEASIFVSPRKNNGYNWGYQQDHVVIYKETNGKWYKIYFGNPRLKKVNNLLITNYISTAKENYYNAYDLKLNKLLIFANAWNNRFNISASQILNYNEENVAYFASSFNEYNLGDNASLILNPLPLACRLNVEYLESIRKQILLSNYRNPLHKANVYYGEGSEIKYLCSVDVSGGYFFNKNLLDLPFPSNTDGNVQYSPSLFAAEKGKYGNLVFISEGGTAYKLMTYDNKAVMSYFLSTAVEGLQDFFTIQGQLYGILDNQIYNFSIVNELANRGDFIVSVEGLQFVGNTPYEALFFSKTNRCLYSFTGANVLNAKQFVDKISEVRNYKYNPATQSIFLITDIGVIVYSLFGIYQIEFLNCQDMYLLNNGVILTDNEGTFKYVKYYKEETTDDYTKENINLETCFYGMNNQTVTINDCLYMRMFSEEHEEGNLEVSATTLSLEGRMTEKTTFRIKESDWDKLTHTIYLRYQPKEQRGLGISFSINSPFKIASLSVGSQADAILVDKVSKGAINAPQRTSNNVEW